MRSWRFHEFGKIENLKIDEVPIPEPGEGEALVRLQYAALNPADKFLVMGQYPKPGKPPFSVGRDGVGLIEKSSGKFKKGDTVILLRSEIGITRDGTLAEYVTVPEESLALLPEGWKPEEGAAGPLVCLTAWQALVDEGLIEPGKVVLVTGASGGVGSASVMLAHAMGNKVIALSRSEEKQKRLRELGADMTFNTDDPEIVKTVQKALEGGRADIVVENLSGPFLQKSINMTGRKGRICIMGLLAGISSNIVIGTFMFKRIHLIGIAVGDYTAAEAQDRWTKIVETLNKTNSRPLVDKAFPFEQVQEAFDYLGKGPMGKVLIGPMF